MATIQDLRRLIALEKKKQAKLNKISAKDGEKAKLRSQLFNLKHGSKIRTIKRIGGGFRRAGSNLTSNVKNASKSFSNQRKKKKGIGGYLQRIADNQ